VAPAAASTREEKLTLIRLAYGLFVLAIGLSLDGPASLAGAYAADAAPATGDRNPEGDSKRAPAPDAAPSSGEDPQGPMHQCKLGCEPQCRAFGNADLAAECREACEAKCQMNYGQ
jgi:hypothetical protein